MAIRYLPLHLRHSPTSRLRDFALLTGLEAAIRGMARVEPIAGLQVGFKELTSLDLGHRVSEAAYLVVWQQDEHLVGFVFRSRREIAIAEVVALAPKLIGLVRGVL